MLPPTPPQPQGGRPGLSDRPCLLGIIFVLRAGLPRSVLPREWGCGSGVTCWRRLRQWQAPGIWQQLHRVLLTELQGAGALDWARAVIDSASSRAVVGGRTPAPTPQTAPQRA